MARVLGPDNGSAYIFLPNGDPGAGRSVTLYSDPACTTLADVAAYQPDVPGTPGSVIASGQVTADENARLTFWFPDGNPAPVLYARVGGTGPITRITADLQTQLVTIADSVAAVEATLTEGTAPAPADALQRRVLAEFYTFADWCAGYGVRGYLGEYGTPASGSDVTAWSALLETYYRALDETGMSATYWSSGGGWGTGYELALYVDSSGSPNVNTAMPPSAVVERHLGVGGARRGTALAGWDFPVSGGGANGIRDPGAFYRVHTAGDFAYLAGRGVRTVRLGMAWERVQPTLNTALNASALTSLGNFLTYAAANRIGVILDLHNYGRYTAADGTTVHVLAESGGTVNTAELSDFWTRMSAWVRADPTRNRAVIGYGIMNEPHDLAAGAFTSALTLHDFTSGVGAWTGSPTRTTSPFADGAATFSVGTGGGQFDDEGNWGNLASYGNTLRMVFQAPAAMAGDFVVDLKAQRGAGNATGSEYSTASAGLNTTISESGPTVLDWISNDGTLASVHWVGFYAGGSGRSGNQNLHLDRVQVGSSKTPVQVWESISAAVVEAIRAGGDSRLVAVGGYAYSQLYQWTSNHPKPWIDDANVIYEAHHYFDLGPTATRTGTYQDSYATVLAAAVTAGY